MTIPNAGKYAYPSTHTDRNGMVTYHLGMTVRQHHVVEILKGMLATSPPAMFGLGRDAENKSICLAACALADALIEAEAATRKQPTITKEVSNGN